MKKFAALYRSLDETTKTTRKLAALTRYFSECDAADGAWAVYFAEEGPWMQRVRWLALWMQQRMSVFGKAGNLW